MKHDKILIWLPWPMGDAILSIPALRAIRRHYKDAEISYLSNNIVREILSPCSFNDRWIEPNNNNPFSIAKSLKSEKFDKVILFKNSFGSALSVFLAAIPTRIGYARNGRGFLLTDKLYQPRNSEKKIKTINMIDYYLAIASWLGAETDNRSLQLPVTDENKNSMKLKLLEIQKSDGPVIILVPGGAFGLSKCWLSNRFAHVADWAINKYQATVIVSVSPEPAEKKIAGEICQAAKNSLTNLGQKPLSLGELKALFSIADLIICNDTGPRHIAIALKRNVITLFGPNDPKVTDTGYEKEIQIVGNVPCAPCFRPKCKKKRHLCMEAITVEMVCQAATKLMRN